MLHKYNDNDDDSKDEDETKITKQKQYIIVYVALFLMNDSKLVEKILFVPSSLTIRWKKRWFQTT